MLAADRDSGELAPAAHRVMDGLSAAIPRGAGRGGVWQLRDRAEMEKVLLGGAAYAVKQGHGTGRDLERCEDHGAVEDTDTAQVSSRAIGRGLHQVGSLGSGNHFLEVQAVDEIFGPVAAGRFAPTPGGSTSWSPRTRPRPARPRCSPRACRPVARSNSTSATASEPFDRETDPTHSVWQHRRGSRGGRARMLADRPLHLRLPGPGSL